MKTNEMKKVLKSMLGDKRYNHSVEVAKQAVRLSKIYDADEEKAEIAGLLHDIMKEQDPDIQLKRITDSGIVLTQTELMSKNLWHQISGMAYVKDVLKIEDEDILNAIRYHTSGRKGMSVLEKVVFISDYTSDDRDYNGVKDMRKLCEKNLEEAMLEGFKFTLVELIEENKIIGSDSIDAYNDIIENKGKDD